MILVISIRRIGKGLSIFNDNKVIAITVLICISEKTHQFLSS